MISYPKFDKQFGHLFSEHKFSNYRLRIEYRFVGDQCQGGPELGIQEQRRHDPRPVT